jgi:formylglycine-generating enzyme required for sulfatase activity
MVTKRIGMIGVLCAVLLGFLSEMNAPVDAKQPTHPWSVHGHEADIGDTFSKALSKLEGVNIVALRRAVRDLMKTFPAEYIHGEDYLRALDVYEQYLPGIQDALRRKDENALRQAEEIIAFRRQALLSNPLLDFDTLLLIKRKPLGDPRRARGDRKNDKGLGKFLGLPQQSSWQLHTMNDTDGWENEICVLSPVGPAGKLTRLYEPSSRRLVNEMDLHFDGDKLMFSMPDHRKFWQVFEMRTDGTHLRQISPDDQPDVHNFDSCYLPNGKIAFISTAPFQGVPCNASVNVGMTYLMDADGKNVRQICFEQDHNFCPTVMNDGRILYLRWEYTDIPHVWARFLFTMNPDGTSQREFYGSGGYWPNAIFFARPIPDHPTKVVGIVTGHHVGRVGELVIFDPVQGRTSTEGVVQRIGGYGQKVQPIIEDKLTLDSWPKFLHPWPLSEKYFLVSCKLQPDDLWGIYLVDVFDNVVLVKEVADYALLEPIPLRTTRKPPVIVDRVDLNRRDALVYLEDIYAGPGLKGVPKGSVEKLRLFTYQFAYRTVAGINHRVGADGPWEPKRILGTVPVEEDGSALFRVPANMPISIQPLDRKGRALQLMRSWMTAMPGENVSCVGCHEKQNSVPLNKPTVASRRKPAAIRTWHGPVRGFSFQREVQPVLDKYCVCCHHNRDDGVEPDLRGDQGRLFAYRNGRPKPEIVLNVPREELVKKYGGVFPPSYVALRGLVRVGGLESDLRLLAPGEFHARTSELVQMLEKGHHGVRLDDEAWERIYTWIDLNAPCHGTWCEVVGAEKIRNDHRRRLTLRRTYGGDTTDPESYPAMDVEPAKCVYPSKEIQDRPVVTTIEGWPLDERTARASQAGAEQTHRSINMANGVKLDLVYIPAGAFLMGSSNGESDERPVTHVEIDKPFWMGRFEITNEQYALYDPHHDSKYEHKGSWMFNEWDLGWPLNQPRQPVVRVSWDQAVGFCRWLSGKTGLIVALPTEAQWEWACRAGTDTPLFYGDLDTDFSRFANMADITMRDLAYDARDQYSPDLVPRDNRFDDEFLVTAEVGSFRPNRWGLYDVHGNVWEWTRSRYARYTRDPTDGRNEMEPTGNKVVRGGSWHDRPKRCRSAFRLAYPSWQRVFNVGFRVIIEIDDSSQFARATEK